MTVISNNKKRILLVTDGIWTPSGFGTVCKNLAYGLKDEFEVAILSWQYIGNANLFDGIKIYPLKDHTFGADQILYTISDFKPDIVFTLGDLWMVNYMANPGHQKVLKDNNVKWVWYLPIDCDNIPKPFIDAIKAPDYLVAMSKHGSTVLDKYSIPHTYIPHGVDTDIYKPIDKQIARQECKQYNDKFVIGCVARNQDRKQYPRLIRAFSLFAKDKEDVVLHMHADPMDKGGMSKDFNNRAFSILLLALDFWGVTKKAYFTQGIQSYCNGVGTADMPKTYAIFDIHANAGTGEGFGLPIIESIACGIPNVMTNYTTAKELIEGRGETVKIKTFIYGSFGTLRAIVDEEDLAAKFEKLYQDWKSGGNLLKQYSNDCIEFAKQYDWKQCIIPQWSQLFNKIIGGDVNADTDT